MALIPLIYPSLAHAIGHVCAMVGRSFQRKKRHVAPSSHLPVAIIAMEALSYQLAAVLLYVVFTQ